MTQGSTAMLPFERPYPISYLPSIDNVSLSCTVFEIIDIFVNMGNPYSGPNFGVLGVFDPAKYFFTILTPKRHMYSRNRVF